MHAAERDRELVQRCLRREPAAWREFVDRYLPLLYHVVHHTSTQLSVPVSPEEVEDMVAEVLTQLMQDNFRTLRQFEGKSRLSTYLVVVGRRLVLRQLKKKLTGPTMQPLPDGQALMDERQEWQRRSGRPEVVEEIHEILRRLPRRIRQIVRMYYLEGRSYEEISTALNIPVNSIGPALSRARRLMWARLQEREQSSSPSAASEPSEAEPEQIRRSDNTA